MSRWSRSRPLGDELATLAERAYRVGRPGGFG
jgi:hypothetical protein